MKKGLSILRNSQSSQLVPEEAGSRCQFCCRQRAGKPSWRLGGMALSGFAEGAWSTLANGKHGSPSRRCFFKPVLMLESCPQRPSKHGRYNECNLSIASPRATVPVRIGTINCVPGVRGGLGIFVRSSEFPKTSSAECPLGDLKVGEDLWAECGLSWQLGCGRHGM